MISIGRLSMLSKHEENQRLYGLSGVRIDSSDYSWPLSGSKTRMESSTSKDTPLAKSAGLLLFLSPLSIYIYIYIYIFFGNFATASSSSLAPATTSSLASARYLIRTNYISILIRPLGCYCNL